MRKRGMWEARKGISHEIRGPNSFKNNFLEFSHEGGRNFPRRAHHLGF
jgi:hypothetical protein